MSDAGRHGTRYRFAGFELEPCERRLLAHGEPVTLTPKVFDTLVLLVERAGHVVSRDELMAALWPRGFVTDANLTKHVWAIRKALGGGCEGDSRFIETVPKLGYRFVEPVERLDDENSMPVDVSATRAGATMLDDGTSSSVDHAASTAPQTFRERRARDRRGAEAAQRFPPLDGHPADAPFIAGNAYRRRRKPWAVVAATLAIVVVGVAAGLAWRRVSLRGRMSPAAPGTTVAIAGFNNLSDDPGDAWLGPALAEMLATEVTATGKMHVSPTELVRAARQGLPVPAAGGYAPPSLAQLRKRLGADFVISGSYLVSGTGTAAKVRVDIVLQDVRNGADIAVFSQTQPVSRLLTLVASAGTTLRSKLGLPAVALGEVWRLASAQPPTPDVARRIGFALDALQAYDPARARDELLQAVAEAPGYARAYALLSRAWSALGYQAKARAAIEQAAAHAGGLPEKQRLRIQARQHFVARDWGATAKSRAALVALQPHDPEPRLRLVRALIRAGHHVAARKALNQLRGAVPNAEADSRVEDMAARVEAASGNYRSATEHARKALELARRRGARGLIAQAELRYGAALENDLTVHGTLPTRVERQALEDFRKLGDRVGMARAYAHLADASHASLADRRENYEQALAIYQQIGDLAGQADVYVELAGVLGEAGDEDGAEAALKHALAVHRTQHDVNGETRALMGLARIASDRSAGKETLAIYGRLLSLAKQDHDMDILIYSLANYANTLRERGQLDSAQKECDQARTVAERTGQGGMVPMVAILCAPLVRDRGHISRAVAMLRPNSADGGVAHTSDARTAGATILPLAEIAIGRGHCKKVRKLLAPWAGKSDASATQQAPGATVVRAHAAALQALCDARLGDLARSRVAATRARALRARILQPRAKFDIDLALARWRGATGHRGQAVATLRALASDADKRHWMASALEARLAAYRLLRKTNGSEADALHDRIRATAKAHGFQWVLARLDRPLPAVATVTPN